LDRKLIEEKIAVDAKDLEISLESVSKPIESARTESMIIISIIIL
jgi:hypothetical protein